MSELVAVVDELGDPPSSEEILVQCQTRPDLIQWCLAQPRLHDGGTSHRVVSHRVIEHCGQRQLNPGLASYKAQCHDHVVVSGILCLVLVSRSS